MLPICYQFWYARKYPFVQHLPGKQPFAPLAQLAEQVTLNHLVAGSSPARCTLFTIGNSLRRANLYDELMTILTREDFKHRRASGPIT
jgi:hypothetical protein